MAAPGSVELERNRNAADTSGRILPRADDSVHSPPRVVVRRAGVWQRSLERAHRYGFPLLALVRRDFQIRYGQTVIGLGWAVLQPLVLLLLYTVVFSVILQLKFRAQDTTGHFALYLMSGMFPFLALSEGVQRASSSLKENQSLLYNVRFPAEVVPIVPVVSATVTEVIGLTLLTIFAALFGVSLSVWITFLPFLIGMRIIATLGVAWLVSVLNVFFTDLGQLLGLVLTSLMFLTPIFYPVEMVPESLSWALTVNPLHHLVEAYRAVILEAQSPLLMLPYLVVWSIGLMALGLVFFRKAIEPAKDFL